MEFFPSLMLGVFFVSLIWWLTSRRGPEASQRSIPDLTNELDRLEALLLKGDSHVAAETLNQIQPEVDPIQGPDGCLLRARLRLSGGDLFAWTGNPEQAGPQLEQALGEIDNMSDAALALELRTRAEASLGLLVGAQRPDPRLAQARAALDREPHIRRPEVLMRLVWVAHHLAQIEHQHGHWPEARVLFERSVAIGRRLLRPGEGDLSSSWDTGTRELIWSHGRRVAADSARDLAFVLQSLGDHEGTMRWLDEAVALMEGATIPPARLRLAQGLIDRASNEPVDAFTGISGHEALLGRAAELGLSCGSDDGRTAACVAEIARANLYPALGMLEPRIEHLRRALELTESLPEPQAGFNRTYLHVALGFALEDHGDLEAAIESHERGVEQGRDNPDPNVRKFAAQSAYRLQQLFFEGERLEDMRRCAAILDQLVPALMPDDRLSFAGMAAHGSGLQHVLDGRADDARRALEHAEALARQAGSPGLSRAVAIDQGRLELRVERPADALPHLRRALEIAIPGIDGPENQGRLADIRLSLANAYLMLERRAEALVECRRAFEIGRGAGSASGREVAAIAAMHLGEAADDEPAECRRYYEAAARLGRLCGRPRGREVADIADQRLRDMTD